MHLTFSTLLQKMPLWVVPEYGVLLANVQITFNENTGTFFCYDSPRNWIFCQGLKDWEKWYVERQGPWSHSKCQVGSNIFLSKNTEVKNQNQQAAAELHGSLKLRASFVEFNYWRKLALKQYTLSWSP